MDYEKLLQAISGMLEEKLEEALEKKLEEKLEKVLEKKLEEKLEEKLEKVLEKKLEEKLEKVLEKKLEEKLEEVLEKKLEEKLEEKLKPVYERLDKIEGRLGVVEDIQRRTTKKLEDLRLDMKIAERDTRRDIWALKDEMETVIEILKMNHLLPR